MSVQVLVASMNQSDHSLLEKMNIHSDVIVGNQCDKNCIEKFDYESHDAIYLNFSEKGVGLNRNNALMRATGDICLFADDDVEYFDDYVEKVEKAFEEHQDADIIIFNVEGRFLTEEVHRVYWYNYLRYGTVRFGIRLNSIRKNGIYFNQCFGGGTDYAHGEDNLFLTECLKKGLKIYAVPVCIAKLTDDRESTWLASYDKKYLRDQGVLYRTISSKYWRLLCLQDAVRHRNRYNSSILKSYIIMAKEN